jgi:tetratricopeptide (TPR) repeat protein
MNFLLNMNRILFSKLRTCKVILRMLLLCACCNGRAQNNLYDSLQKILSGLKNDTGKVNTMISQCRSLFQTGNNTVIRRLCSDAQKLSETLNYSTGKARSLSMLGNMFQSGSQFDSAAMCYAAAMKILITTKNVNDVAAVYNNFGLNRYLKGDYANALEYYNKAIEINSKAGNKKWLYNNYQNIGNVYSAIGNFPKAYEAYFNALRIAEGLGDPLTVAYVYQDLGLLDAEQRQWANAIGNYNKALKILKSSGDNSGLAGLYHDIASSYLEIGNKDTALHYFFAALALNKELEDELRASRNLSSIGVVYYESGEFEKSLPTLLKALKMKKEIGAAGDIGVTLGNLGELFLKMKKYKVASSYFVDAIKYAEMSGDKPELEVIYSSLSAAYEKMGESKKAYETYKKHIEVKNFLFGEESTKKMVQQQMQYEFEKKTTTDSIKNSESKRVEQVKHERKISSQRTYTYLGAGGFLLMVFVAGISIRAFRNKKHATEEIARQKRIVEEKQKEILDSIHYASRIQRALITSEKYICRNLKKLNSTS